MKYKAEEVLLTVGMKEDRIYEIDVEKQKLKEYQKKYLDLRGCIFKEKGAYKTCSRSCF